MTEADEDHRGDADVPGADGGVLRGCSVRFEREEGRAENRQREADRRRRVETERHRGDSAVCSACEADREPRVNEITDEHAERAAGKHFCVNDFSRETEGADQDRREEREDGEVVEREAEEAVDVAGDKPPTTLHRHDRRVVPTSGKLRASTRRGG